VPHNPVRTSRSRAFETVHVFGGKSDGAGSGGLVLFKGVLYGVTSGGGPHGLGTIFSLDPAIGTFTTLYSFDGKSGGGTQPIGALAPFAGSLYGVTASGGVASAGTIFRLTP
jgi:uncharacterized repeat protein (TIGR03803 family)